MLITPDRWIAGSVSGGCLETDLARRAWWLTERAPTVVTYDSSVPDEASLDELHAAFGLGCGGTIDILLERVVEPFARIDAWLSAERRCALATVFSPHVRRVLLDDEELLEGEAGPALREALATAIASGATTVQHLDGEDVLIEGLHPAPRLYIFGTGHDVVPVVQLARRIGWRVAVCARHASHAMRERCRDADELLIGEGTRVAAGAYALVMSHDIAVDGAHLATLLASQARYIGVLGPASRTRRLLDAIGVGGDPRLHAPVGLAIGAEGPEQIALSIVAELQAVHVRAAALPLRELAGPIHARAS